MTTRAELRLALRRRLEDSQVAPIWDDDTLHDALAAGLREYGTRLPREQTATIAIAAETTTIPVTTPGLAGLPARRIARVFDERGEPVPPWRNGHDRDGMPCHEPLAQSWRWWNSTLFLERPVPAPVTWRIEYFGDRVLPNDDSTAVEIVAGDEEIVLLLATAVALERRLVAEGKRGAGGRDGSGLSALAARSRQRADLLLDRCLRRARGGTVVSGS